MCNVLLLIECNIFQDILVNYSLCNISNFKSNEKSSPIPLKNHKLGNSATENHKIMILTVKFCKGICSVNR